MTTSENPNALANFSSEAWTIVQPTKRSKLTLRNGEKSSMLSSWRIQKRKDHEALDSFPIHAPAWLMMLKTLVHMSSMEGKRNPNSVIVYSSSSDSKFS